MKKFSLLFLGALLFLSACSNAESELNDFYEDFTGSLDEEQNLAEINEEYNALESEKSDLQEQLNEANLEQINSISPELIENTEQRLALLDEETEMMTDAKKAFEPARESVEEISDETYKQEAESLIQAMDARFSAQESLNNTYKEALAAEMELFEYLGDEEVTQDVIDEHLNQIAEYSEPLNEASSSFTEETEKVNQIKAEIEQILEAE